MRIKTSRRQMSGRRYRNRTKSLSTVRQADRQQRAREAIMQGRVPTTEHDGADCNYAYRYYGNVSVPDSNYTRPELYTQAMLLLLAAHRVPCISWLL